MESSTLNLLPRHGYPQNALETASQAIVKALATLPIYIAIVSTLTLLVVLFGVPFVSDR